MDGFASRRDIIAWSLYDWANSAFPTIVTTFIFAAYFTKKVAINDIIGTSQWGNAMALAGLLAAIFSPIFGAIADHSGKRKPWLGFFTLVSIIASAALWYVKPSSEYVNLALTCVVLGTLGFEIGMVFYNAILPSLAPKHYIGRVSGWAWGLGYVGGLVALVIALFGFVQTEPSWLDTKTAQQIRICGPFIAVWFGVFALPLFFLVPDTPPTGRTLFQSVHRGLTELFVTLKTLPQQKQIFTFLLARLLYIDGLNTIFAFGGIYAAGTFGMTLTEVIKFGIGMNVAAGLGAAGFAWVDDFFGAKRTILISLVGLSVLTTSILLIQTKLWFWILALCLSIFVGPVQAASRSMMARLAPKEKVTEMFGLFAFSGKVTAFIGPWLLGLLTLHFNSQRAGMASVLLFFIIGALILLRVKEPYSGE